MIGLLRTRRWFGGLLFAVVVAVACSYLGRWQWNENRAAHGDLQNLVYAFNWWIFAAVALGIWAKALRDEVRRTAATRTDPVTPGQVEDGEVTKWDA